MSIQEIYQTESIKQLLEFYQVETLVQLIEAQAIHIEKLQDKVLKHELPIAWFNKVREG